jgi:hypothetical protein
MPIREGPQAEKQNLDALFILGFAIDYGCGTSYNGLQPKIRK